MSDDTPDRSVDLPRGYVDDEGEHHQDAKLRVPTLADEIGAEEDVREQGYSRDNSTAFEAAFVARCLVKLGDIPEPNLNHLLRMRRGEIAGLRQRLDELEEHDLEAAQGAEGNATETDEAS